MGEIILFLSTLPDSGEDPDEETMEAVMRAIDRLAAIDGESFTEAVRRLRKEDEDKKKAAEDKAKRLQRRDHEDCERYEGCAGQSRTTMSTRRSRRAWPGSARSAKLVDAQPDQWTLHGQPPSRPRGEQEHEENAASAQHPHYWELASLL